MAGWARGRGVVLVESVELLGRVVADVVGGGPVAGWGGRVLAAAGPFLGRVSWSVLKGLRYLTLL